MPAGTRLKGATLKLETYEKDVGIRTRLPAGGMLGSVLQNLALRLAKNEELSKKKGFLHFSLTIFLYICCNETELF